ncbi:phosphate regulon sensor protein PhoR [Lachnospiraceae bacterium KM106-2]|nr:phosphate regulon sensor protein PhoR [Lachnospiraceae bacterium KM106-2]
MREIRKYRLSLRRYMMLVSISTLLFSCFLAGLIVFGGMKLFYHGNVTHELLGGLTILFCLLVTFIDGFLFWSGASHLIKPLLELNDVVTEVARGNFKVQIKRTQIKDKQYQYTNEIDELSKNVNKMVNELDAMQYMRKDFMRNVSHEVKTPIAAITGFTELLLDERLPEEQRREYLEVINQESLGISRLCQNMLSMAMLDHQQIVTKTKQIQLDEQIRKCIILLSEKWSDREIDFVIDLDSVMIESDPDMLQQVWINLIDNAIKYSNSPCRIDISAKEQEENIEVVIRDYGKGIERDKVKKIFDVFYQCDESHKNYGHGLGLSIVKRILELLSGTILCESAEGVGTIMRVQIKKVLR